MPESGTADACFEQERKACFEQKGAPHPNGKTQKMSLHLNREERHICKGKC